MYQDNIERGERGEPLAPVLKVGLDCPPAEPPPVMFNDTANLERYLTVPFTPEHRCDPKYIVMQCNCGRTIVPSTCMSLDCVACAPYVSKRRAQATVRRLLGHTHKHNRRNVIYTVLTVPEYVRNHFFTYPKEWRKVRKKLWYVLKNYFGGLYGVEATHPAGDKDKVKFHPHLNFLWVQRPGFRPFLDVDQLRQRWQKILKVNSADVYSQYSNHIRRIIHWCKYVTRTFPGTHTWTGPLRWFGKYPKNIKIKHECTCPECQGRFRVIGFLDARHVHEWERSGMMLGRDPPWYDDNLIQHTKSKTHKLPGE